MARGPALSLGYDSSRTGFVGLNRVSMGPTLSTPSDDAAQGYELSLQFRIGKAPRWLITATMPLSHVEGEYTMSDPRLGGLPSHSTPTYAGNLAVWITRVDEPTFEARSFIGMLFPALSVGVVVPTGSRPSGHQRELPKPLEDALLFYRRDTAAVVASLRGRLDFFVLYGLALEGGFGLQVLETGDILINGQSLVAFEPFSFLRRLPGGIGQRLDDHEVPQRIRAVAEWNYLRETGQPRILVGEDSENGWDGARHLLRAGLDVAPGDIGLVDLDGATLAIRRELRFKPDLSDGWSLDVRYAW